MSRGPRILAIGHQANHTGAPKVLLNVLPALRELGTDSLRILLRVGGPALAQYEAIAPTSVAYTRYAPPLFSSETDPSLPWWRRVSQRVRRWRAKRIQAALLASIRRDIHAWGPDVLYINSVGSLDLVGELGLRCPMVLHVHEKRATLDRFPRQTQTLLRTLPLRCIAVSESVREDLIGFGLPADRISVVYNGVDAGDLQTKAGLPGSMRKALGVSKETFLLGAIGSILYEIKGVDIFLRLLRNLRDRGHAFKAIWVGDGPDYHRAKEEVKALGLTEHVVWTGLLEDPLPWMASLDVLVHCAREDSAPLVFLEAGALGIPTVAFRDAGGAAELLAEKRGYLVAPMTTQAMTAVLCEALGNPGERTRRGGAMRRACETQFSTTAFREAVLAQLMEAKRS